jgi:hypothetical protein
LRGLAAAVGVLMAFQAPAADPGELPGWILASADARAVAGKPFEILLVSLSAEPLPDQINVRLKGDLDERILRMRATTRAASGSLLAWCGSGPPARAAC